MSRDEAVVVPDGWLSRGEAFVRGRGTQLAVFGGIPGERARVHVIDREGHPQRARLLATVGAPSPNRVEPPCERYGTCGRCPLMHVSARGRRGVADELLAEAFVAFAPAIRPSPLVAEDTPLGWQHQVELVTGWSDERHPRLGVIGRERRRVVAIPQCPVATEGLRELMKVAAHHMIALDVRPWDNRGGSLRAVLGRESRATGEILVTLVFGRSNPFAGELAERIGAGLQRVAGVHVHWNDDPATLLAVTEEGGTATSLLYGKPAIEERIDGLRLRLGPVDPFAANPSVAERQWGAIVDAIAPAEGDAVVDLASGVGARTLLLARRTGWALGVDRSEDATRRARENAVLNSVPAEFTTGGVAEALEASAAKLRGRRPLVVADVGRRGLEDVDVERLVELSPRRVALVGTNPRALARDAGRIASRGWTLRSVTPWDVAPYTPFFESVALLESADAAAPSVRAPRRRRLG
jgi:23S rRNA (uracil1939-C5)-methyltransferase